MTAPRTIEQVEAEIAKNEAIISAAKDPNDVPLWIYERSNRLCAELAALKGDANDRAE